MPKPLEFYAALAAGVLFVIFQHKEKTWLARISIAGMSGLLAYSLAPEVAAYFGRSENLAVLGLSAFSYALMDLVGAILADRETVMEFVRRRLRGGPK